MFQPIFHSITDPAINPFDDLVDPDPFSVEPTDHEFNTEKYLSEIPEDSEEERLQFALAEWGQMYRHYPEYYDSSTDETSQEESLERPQETVKINQPSMRKQTPYEQGESSAMAARRGEQAKNEFEPQTNVHSKKPRSHGLEPLVDEPLTQSAPSVDPSSTTKREEPLIDVTYPDKLKEATSSVPLEIPPNPHQPHKIKRKEVPNRSTNVKVDLPQSIQRKPVPSQLNDVDVTKINPGDEKIVVDSLIAPNVNESTHMDTETHEKSQGVEATVPTTTKEDISEEKSATGTDEFEKPGSGILESVQEAKETEAVATESQSQSEVKPNTEQSTGELIEFT